MNWFRENRFLGTFFIVFGVCLIAVLWFFFSAKSDYDEATARFANTSTELNRLQRLNPYPSEDNLRKMKAYAEDYSSALAKLKEELKMHVAPAAPLAPTEFQSQLRVTMNAVTDKARSNKVKLPDKFFLGFDEFAAALPSEAVAPLLGQELGQIEWLLNSVLDARPEAVTAFRRMPLAQERGSPAGIKSGPASTIKSPERNVVELTFFSTQTIARRVINQIAAANQHFCVIRLLHVRNEKAKGPPREVSGETAPSVPAPSPGAKAAPALNFIVGTEKVETTAQIEIVRFSL